MLKHNDTHTTNNASARQRAVVVIGAGRSGTSSITRGLQALGIELGNHLREGRGKNPTGFFEDKALLSLNKKLRRRLKVRADSVALIDDQAWDQPKIRALEKRAKKIIRSHFSSYPLWGYKYGRTLRLLPFWERVFDSMALDVSYVVAIRNPMSVARSRAKLDARRGRQEHSDLEWLVSVVPYFRRLKSRSFVVVDYDFLMDNPVAQLERIATALDLPQTEQTHETVSEYANKFLQSGMRHSQFTREDLFANDSVNPVTRDAYLTLRLLAKDQWNTHSAEFWGQWERVEQALKPIVPLLKHIDRIEADRRHARLHPAGPFQVIPSLIHKLRAS